MDPATVMSSPSALNQLKPMWTHLLDLVNARALQTACLTLTLYRLQQASHIRSMLEFIERTGIDITTFAKDTRNIVLTNWVNPKMDSLSTGTINAYLGTYQKFLLEFITEERLGDDDLPILRIFRNIKPKLKGLRKNCGQRTEATKRGQNTP